MFDIAIIGAGFAGTITAYGLNQLPGVRVTVFERANSTSDGSIGAGLNMNPNAMSCLRGLFPEMAESLDQIGYPRRGVRAVAMNGDVLFDKPFLQNGAPALADAVGQRLAWRDANLITRRHIKDIIRNSHEVQSVTETPEAEKPLSLTVKSLEDGVTFKQDFDYVFTTDGRYSRIRQAKLGTPPAWYSGVANFRCLIEDTSNSMFDDLELIYNPTASPDTLPPHLQNNEAARYPFQAIPRLAVMRVPSMGKDHLYIFGNFGVEHGKKISPDIKNAEFIRALFTPVDGKVTAKNKWLIDAVCKRADALHWARFQDTEECFFTCDNRICFLGDAGKAFSPTIGLGAGAAIEQACVAVVKFFDSYCEFKSHSSQNISQAMLDDFARRLTTAWRPRVNFIADISGRAAMHLNPDTGFGYEDEMKAWQTPEVAHIAAFSRLWKDYMHTRPFSSLVAEAFGSGGSDLRSRM